MQTGTNERPGLPIALVIGGGGMGMSTARRLGQSHRVVLASQSAGKNADREAALREDGIDAVAVQFDVTDPDSVAGLAKFVAGQGPLRTLAHVAGLSPSMGDWHQLFSVNLIGTALMERACLELAFPGTAAVFVSSSAGHLAEPPARGHRGRPRRPAHARVSSTGWTRSSRQDGQTPLQAYRLSKWALNRMCRRRAGAWGAKGARIVSMSPGPIATPMGARELEGPSRGVKLNLMRQAADRPRGHHGRDRRRDRVPRLRPGLLHHRHGPAGRRRDRGGDPARTRDRAARRACTGHRPVDHAPRRPGHPVPGRRGSRRHPASSGRAAARCGPTPAGRGCSAASAASNSTCTPTMAGPPSTGSWARPTSSSPPCGPPPRPGSASPPNGSPLATRGWWPR